MSDCPGLGCPTLVSYLLFALEHPTGPDLGTPGSGPPGLDRWAWVLDPRDHPDQRRVGASTGQRLRVVIGGLDIHVTLPYIVHLYPTGSIISFSSLPLMYICLFFTVIKNNKFRKKI